MSDREKWIREYLKMNGLSDTPIYRETAAQVYNSVYGKRSRLED